MKSNYALVNFPLRCNLDHLSEILRRELTWQVKENTCFYQCKGSFPERLFLCLAMHSICATRNIKWCINELPSLFSKQNQELNGIFIYLHKGRRTNGHEYKITKRGEGVWQWLEGLSQAISSSDLPTCIETSQLLKCIKKFITWDSVTLLNRPTEICRKGWGMFYCFQHTLRVWKFHPSSFHWY